TDLRAETFARLLGHLLSSKELADDADSLADVFSPLLEDAVGSLADILGCDARHLGFADRERQRVRAVGSLFRSHAEQVEVVPVERGQQERHRQTEVSEDVVDPALAVEVRTTILFLKNRHPL